MQNNAKASKHEQPRAGTDMLTLIQINTQDAESARFDIVRALMLNEF